MQHFQLIQCTLTPDREPWILGVEGSWKYTGQDHKSVDSMSNPDLKYVMPYQEPQVQASRTLT